MLNPFFIQWTGMKLVHSVFALPENRPTKQQIDFLLDILGYRSFRHFEKNGKDAVTIAYTLLCMPSYG